MNKDFKLDEWDCKLIHAFKHSCSENPVSVNMLKEIWGKRCNMKVEHTHISYVVQRLVRVAKDLGLLDDDYAFQEFLWSLDPKMNWKFGCLSNH